MVDGPQLGSSRPAPGPASDAGNRRWWEDSTTSVLVSGVFEGGGAKGAAYVGALRAMRDEGWWFRAVAGASAGAITAVLVAAGLSPEEMEDLTPRTLNTLAGVPIYRGLRRLGRRTGYYSNDQLLQLLEATLAAQVERFGVARDSDSVTFGELYQATGIELYVVAADLTAGQQLVFNHIATPNCQVAHAVVASASIPFAFESSTLALVDPEDGLTYGHTVVDGGVWSNFPTFVFADASYRKYVFETDHRPEGDLVLGFVLEERPEAVSSPLRDPRFAGSDDPVWPAEVKEQRRGRPDLASPLGKAFRDRPDAPGYGRYPLPSQPWLRRLTLHLDTGVFHFRGWLGASGLVLILALLAVFLSTTVIPALIPDDLTAWFRAISDGDSAVADRVRAVTQMLGLILLGFAILLLVEWFLLAGLALAGNTILGRALRRLGFGLARTYLAGAMAKPWVGLAEGEHVIRLPIPPEITTMSFNLREADLQSLVEAARKTTAERIAEIRSSHSGPLLGPDDLRAHRLDTLLRGLPTLRRRLEQAYAAFPVDLSWTDPFPDHRPLDPATGRPIAGNQPGLRRLMRRREQIRSRRDWDAAQSRRHRMVSTEHVRVQLALLSVWELLKTDASLMPAEEQAVRRACVDAMNAVYLAASTQGLLLEVLVGADPSGGGSREPASARYERIRETRSREDPQAVPPTEWDSARTGEHVARALEEIRSFEETFLLWADVGF